jgi:hypothetical protein
MIRELPEMKMPDWLSGNNYHFEIKNLIRDSLFFPSCGTDNIPVKYFMGNVYSFIYVDHGISEYAFNRNIDLSNSFIGYKIIHKEKVSKIQLDNGNENNSLIRISPREPPKEWNKNSYCYWNVFRKKLNTNTGNNPDYFSLLYLSSEAIIAYYILYNQYKISPKILCIMQEGSNFGGNWTDYTDRNSDLAQAIFRNKELPEFLLNGGYGSVFGYENSLWPEYGKLIYKNTDYSGTEQRSFSLWGKQDK